MELITFDFNKKYNIGKIIACLGEFDGLHVAHQTLIHQAITFSKEIDAKTAVFSFEPHPDFVLKKREHQGYLTPLRVKIQTLEALGIDYFIILPFTLEFSKLTYQEFEEQVLSQFDIKKIVVGFDYRYGHKGLGNTETLKNKYDVFILNKMEMFDHKIGSNEIRELLITGNINAVTSMLGRYYRIVGKVVSGNQVGRRIGIRTANIDLDEEFQALRKGVYATFVLIDHKKYLGVTNIGNNPTINYTVTPRLEVHILDFNEDIYDKEIIVDFVSFLRDEIKYNDIDLMIAQIHQDIKDAKMILEKYL